VVIAIDFIAGSGDKFRLHNTEEIQSCSLSVRKEETLRIRRLTANNHFYAKQDKIPKSNDAPADGGI